MPGKTRPYEQFGSFILFKKLETDALGDLWRAARIDDRHLGPLVAVRRLSGGDRDALVQAAADAKAIVPMLSGTSFVKDQMIDVANGVPFVAHEYAGGRSLRHVVDRAHGGAGMTPNPIPIDQAVLIAEKVALSLATTADLRYGGTRLSHGALIPQFVWISDEGEIRVAGQQLGKGIIASLKDAKVAAAIGRYFSPEIRSGAEPSPAADIYSMGAVLYLLVTGNEPPDAMNVSAFGQSIRAGKTTAGDPIPDDIRAILDKSLTIDAGRRYASIGDMKQALSALAHGGKYSGTTFNLAFYLNTLMKKELEGEAIERDKESKVNVAPYLEQQIVLTAPPAPVPVANTKSRVPLYGAAAAAIILLAGGAFWALKPAQETARPLPVKQSSVKPAAAAVPAPVVQATMMTPPPAATTASADPAAEKKAFEAAVSQKLQEEMTKLQAQFNKQLPQSKPAAPRPEKAPAPVLTASIAPQPQREQQLDDRAPSAAALDERRLAAQQASSTQPPLLAPAPVTQTVAAQPEPQPAAPAPAPATKEGDLVNFDEVDVRPQVTSRPTLMYPPMAMRQKAQTLVILSVLVSENGDVQDVRVLRGDSRFGFNDEAVRLLRATHFRPAMKDGKRVKTWLPQPVEFKLQ